MIIVYTIAALLLLFKITNIIAYQWMKKTVLESRKWDLNICCGKTDGGGINADIVQHIDLPYYCQIDDITNLPFKDKQFSQVLCSHTMEHVRQLHSFYGELQRVSHNITILIPPLWDISAAFNVLEHKWLFLTFKHQHSSLPPHIPLPMADFFHRIIGQKIKA